MDVVELDRLPLAEGRRAAAQVDDDVEHAPPGAAHELALARVRLEVDAPQRAAARARLVVLDERRGDAVLRPRVLAVGLHEEPARVAVDGGSEQDEAVEPGREALHGRGELRSSPAGAAPGQDLEGGLLGRAVESGVAHAKDRDHAPRRAGPPDLVGLHLLPLRRVLAVAEGRRAVRRRPPRRGGLPHRRGARPPREHIVLDRRALLPGARLRGLPRAPGGRPGGVPPPPPQGRPGQPHRGRHAALLARPEPLRVRHRGRPRQRRGDRAQGVALAGRGRDRGDRGPREGADRRHGPDGVLRLLPAPPADAARHPRRDRRLALAGGALAARADRRRHARHRPERRAPAPARRALDEDRPPPQGGDAGDRRRDALRGLQARGAHALLLLELPGLRALARRPALDPAGARLRGLRPRRGAVRRPHPGVPPEVSLYRTANGSAALARLPWLICATSRLSASRPVWPRCSRAASSWTSSTPSRRRSPRTPAPPRSWRSSASPPTSAATAASRACRTRSSSRASRRP